MVEPKNTIIVVLGQTATGKSALAVKLAKKFDGEVISADSRQVYRGLNIGTGKITKKEMAGIPHHLLDIADPRKRYTASDFVRDGREKIAAIFSRNKTPIICGGTGFYISALLGEIELSDVKPDEKLRKRLASKTLDELVEILKKLNPARAKTIDRYNSRRLIRAIELSSSPEFKKTKNKIGEQLYRQNIKAKIIKIGLTLPPDILKERIRVRLLDRICHGMIAEARKLHKSGLSWKRMDELGLEYRYLAQHLQKRISKQEMIEKLSSEIWQYARRQMTWFKRDKKIKWFTPHQFGEVNEFIRKYIE